MKSLWAVACVALAATISGMLCGGCASVPAHPAEGEAAAARPPLDNEAALPGNAYRIGPEDVLRVSVWENKELTLDVTVRPDGKISYPLIQDVHAEGLTAVELADVIRFRLLAYLKDPQVSVIVTQVNAPKIYVVGSVAKPGSYVLRGETTVLHALALAGGFTQFASPRSIRLIRGLAEKQEVHKINWYNIVDEGGEGNLLLKPGDTIVVP